jgi:hypothetical protein
MPLPGGAIDKLGNSYELNWTACCLAEVLADLADEIRLEPPGEEGEGIEFWLIRGGAKEFHQVKLQQAGKGRWSVADLYGVLRHFKSHLLADPNSRCVFISTEAASPLAELTRRAWQSETAREFIAHLQSSDDARRGFEKLCQLWGPYDRD